MSGRQALQCRFKIVETLRPGPPALAYSAILLVHVLTCGFTKPIILRSKFSNPQKHSRPYDAIGHLCLALENKTPNQNMAFIALLDVCRSLNSLPLARIFVSTSKGGAQGRIFGFFESFLQISVNQCVSHQKCTSSCQSWCPSGKHFQPSSL